jgi:hypothetical protein
MKKHQKQILALAVILVFTATVLLLTGLSEAVKPDKPDPVMTLLEEIYDIVLDTNSKVEGFLIQKTGQTTSYATEDDGDLQKGVEWPVPRFTDNGDGTVTDNLTGLIWLKEVNCGGTKNWDNALTYCNNLASESCGLSDGSIAGDWRLPNVTELQSLIHYGFYGPSVPDTVGTGQWSEGDPFSNVETAGYWSSTTAAYNTDQALVVNLTHGALNDGLKTSTGPRVWPVRGGN